MFHLHCMSWDAAIRLSFAKLGWRAHFPAEKQHVGRHCLTLILLNASRKHRFQAGVSIVNTDLEPMGMEKMENQNSNFSLIMYCGNLPRCILFQNAWPLCMPQDLGKGSYHDGLCSRQKQFQSSAVNERSYPYNFHKFSGICRKLGRGLMSHWAIQQAAQNKRFPPFSKLFGMPKELCERGSVNKGAHRAAQKVSKTW